MLRRLAKRAGIPRHTADALDKVWLRLVGRIIFVLVRMHTCMQHRFAQLAQPSDEQPSADEDEDEDGDGDEDEDEGEEEGEEEAEESEQEEGAEGPFDVDSRTMLPTTAMVREAFAMLPSRQPATLYI